MDKIKDEIAQRILDSSLIGIERFMEEHTGWFVLLTYILIISALGAISDVLRVMQGHVILVSTVIKKGLGKGKD